MRRPTSLREFVARFEPECLDDNDAMLEERWKERACSQLVRSGESVGADPGLLRATTWTMLQESVDRLTGAASALRRPFDAQPGILSWIVAGSAARGEAVASSDVDFNVFLTTESLQALKRSKDRTKKDVNAGRMLIRREVRFRKCIGTELIERLRDAHVAVEGNPTLKPFCVDCLQDDDPLSVAPIIFATLIFSSVPVTGEDSYYRLLDQVLTDQHALRLGLYTLLALARGAEDAVAGETDGTTSDARKPLHRVATTISAMSSVGRRERDPQMPYWWTFEGDGSWEIDPLSQAALERFLVAVTLARAARELPDPRQRQLMLEQAMTTLGRVLDEFEENAVQRGNEEAAEFWREVLALFLDPAETRCWMNRLNLLWSEGAKAMHA